MEKSIKTFKEVTKLGKSKSKRVYRDKSKEQLKRSDS